MNYSWSPVFDISEDTVANPNVFPTSNTTYILTVSDLNNCEAIDSVVVSIGTNPLADAGNAIGTFFPGYFWYYRCQKNEVCGQPSRIATIVYFT